MKKLLMFCLLALPAYSATGISAAASAWNTAATWKVAEAGAGAIQVTRSANTETTTSYVYSTAFTCTNNDVIEGMVLHLYRVGTSGTVSVALSEDGGVTATKEVTVNASDLPAAQSEVYFVFSSTLTCDGGVDYKVGVKESAGGSGAYVYRDGTAGNWFHILQTSTAYGAAPAAADNLHIVGFAVTMDSTDSTDHGTVDIGSGGSVTFGVTAATAYVLKASGDINIWSGGTLNVGTVGTAMPSGSTGTILLDCGSNVQYGLYVRNGGTFVMQGASKTTWTYLASDEAVNSTELTTADSTGWADNDVIAIASTTRTAAQSETGTLNGAASGVTLTVDGFGGAGGGLAYAHSGTAPIRAEITNLTRNVRFSGVSTALQSYINVEATAEVNLDYAEFFYIGYWNSIQAGITLATTSGSFTMDKCSYHDTAQNAKGIYLQPSTSGIYVRDNVFWNTADYAVYAIGNTGTMGTFTFSGNVLIKGGSSALLYLGEYGSTITSNVFAGSGGYGITVNYGTGSFTSFDGNTFHSNAGYPLYLVGNLVPVAMSNITSWRNNDVGLLFQSSASKVSILTGRFFGNATANMGFYVHATDILIRGVDFSGDSTFSTPTGLDILSHYMFTGRLESCTFGVVAGIYTAHTTGDITVGPTGYADIVGSKVTLSSATPFKLEAAGLSGNRLMVSRLGGVAGSHKSWFKYGTIQTDSVIYKTAAPSERVTPNSATVKIESARFPKTVANGATATFSVWVRKSEAADAGGADYNGAQPQLVILANPALGIDADVVGDTMTAAIGDWEELTYTTAAATDNGTIEAVIRSNGTAGWINVSDWQTAGATTFWLDGLPAYGLGTAAVPTTRAYPVMQ